MKEVKLSDDQIQQWLKGPESHNILVPMPLPFTKSELIRQLVNNPFGNMGGPAVMRRAKPKASKKRWTAFESKHYDIAIKDSDGTVVVKGYKERLLTLWIQPNGEAGTTPENSLELEHLANEEFAKALIEITNQIGEWANRANGRKSPQGPSLLLEKSLNAVIWRRNDYREEEAKDGFFFKSATWEWPFCD